MSYLTVLYFFLEMINNYLLFLEQGKNIFI